MVPGLDVAQINSSTWAISARGFNLQFADKLLVLVDGRAVYTPLFGGVYGDTVDVPLENGAEGEELRLHFTVADSGVGILPSKLKLIFDPFSQADGSTTRKYGGTGLGLTISARLVDMMGGRIWVESEVGQGSKFHFTARMTRGTRGAGKEGRGGLPREIVGLRALVVDDNATNRRSAGGDAEALGDAADVHGNRRNGAGAAGIGAKGRGEL